MSILNNSSIPFNKLAKGAEIRKKEKNVKELVRLIDEYVRENGLCFLEMALAFTTMTDYFRKQADSLFFLKKKDEQ